MKLDIVPIIMTVSIQLSAVVEIHALTLMFASKVKNFTQITVTTTLSACQFAVTTQNALISLIAMRNVRQIRTVNKLLAAAVRATALMNRYALVG